MALIALVGASEMLPDGGLRALAQIAGETLIERQAARLADVGVTHMAVAVGAVPGELLATCDRIRRRGMEVTPVREAEIGRAHVCTPVTNAHHECCLLLEKYKDIKCQP